MNLYVLERAILPQHYDYTVSVVVIARSPAEAKIVHTDFMAG